MHRFHPPGCAWRPLAARLLGCALGGGVIRETVTPVPAR